ncbi:hypothetical protein M8J77_015895 [Diaphorina citri]|nr:hypothetical protein M8J77_015895 [Diaphorina citri]
MVQKIHKNHYVATPHTRGYSTDGEESQRTASEIMMIHERHGGGSRPHTPSRRKDKRRHRSRSEERLSPHLHGNRDHHLSNHGLHGNRDHLHSNRSHDHLSNHGLHGNQGYENDGSDIYVTSAAYSPRPPSEMSSRYSHPPSHYSYRSVLPVHSSGTPHPAHLGAPSEISTVKSKISRKPGMTIETMSAPNPFCPNTKGICCLMLLLNLGLILVTLGFVIVIQFFEPFIIWILGVIFLIFGFLTLMGSLIYCVYVCRDARTPKQVAMQDHYWTHHWTKSFGARPPSDIHYRHEEDRY